MNLTPDTPNPEDPSSRTETGAIELTWEDGAYQAADDLIWFRHPSVIEQMQAEGMGHPKTTTFPDRVGTDGETAARLMIEQLEAAEQGQALVEVLESMGFTLDEIEEMAADTECDCGGQHGPQEVWGALGRIALVAMSHKSGPVTPYDVIPLIASKQADYGHDNINRYGISGIMVRISDKIARLANLTRRAVEPEHESLQDTLADIVGYVIIARMLQRGTFNLQLEADMEGDK